MENILDNTCFISKDKVISLLELVLNNCVFFFRKSSNKNSKELQLVPLCLQSLPKFTLNTLGK